MSQVIGKHGLEHKQAMETSMTPRHAGFVFQSTKRRTTAITHYTSLQDLAPIVLTLVLIHPGASQDEEE